MGMIALQNIEPKTVVMSCEPYVYVPYEPRKQFVCAYCVSYFKPLEDKWIQERDALYSSVQTGLENVGLQDQVVEPEVPLSFPVPQYESQNDNFSESPIESVESKTDIDQENQISELLPCPYCCKLWYCCQECMDLDAIEHLRYECLSLQKFDIEWAKDYYQYCDDIITDIRLLIKTMNRRMIQLETGSCEFDEEYQLLISNMDCYDEDVLLTLRGVVQYANYLVPDHVDMDEDELLEIYCKHRVNMFGLWAPTEECLGYGVYPRASYFNHSCWPNTTFYKNETSKIPYMDFITALPIDEKDEVCISYIDISAGLMGRRQTLLDKYFFHCTCQRCQYQEEYPQEKDPYYVYWVVPETTEEQETQVESTEETQIESTEDTQIESSTQETQVESSTQEVKIEKSEQVESS